MISDRLTPTDPADLFCWIYDRFDHRWFLDRTAVTWLEELDERNVQAVAEDIAFGRLGADTLVEGSDRGDPTNRARRQLISLAILDSVLAYAIPGTSGTVPPSLAHVARSYAMSASLSSSRTPGGLVPRIVKPSRVTAAAENLAAAFNHVLRVPAHFWDKADHRWLEPRASDLDPSHRADGIRVGIAPLLGSLDELRIEPRTLGGQPSYAIAPVDSHKLRERIGRVLDAFDHAGCELGIVPELALTAPLLEHWRALMRKRPPPPESPLQWVLVGTGPVEREGTLPPNRAVILCRRTANQLWSQDKTVGFTLEPKQIEEWGLSHLKPGPRDEHITFGRPQVIESAAGRFGVLVCEDVGRTMTVGPIAGEHGVSLVISPIFSKEILQFRWEHQAAERHDVEFGCRVVVANSLAVSRWRLENGKSLVHPGEHPGVLLVRAAVAGAEADPGAGSVWIGQAVDPEEVIVAHVSSRGVSPWHRIGRDATGRFRSTAADPHLPASGGSAG
jgi:predicted amidohydrolase